MRTVYYTKYSNWGYSSKEECEAAEKKHEEDMIRWNQEFLKNSPSIKLEKLINELKECMNIWPGTIATCSFDSIRIKGMVRVCQEFAEENKEYLKHY